MILNKYYRSGFNHRIINKNNNTTLIIAISHQKIHRRDSYAVLL